MTQPIKVSTSLCAQYSNDEVYRAVKQAVDLVGGIGAFVRPGERILIKPNMLGGKPAEAGVTTHPTVVSAAIRLVIEAGATPLVGDSPGMGSLISVAKKCGIAEAAALGNAALIDLKTPVIVDATGTKSFKRFEIAKEALEPHGIINLPKLKTHAQMFLTMGVKNTFGCVPGMRKAQWHLTAGTDVERFADMMLDLHINVKPRLSILDAVVSMEGNGPMGGNLRNTGFVAASADAVALDAAITKMLGRRTNDVPILKAASARSFPGTDYSNIEMLGAMPEAKVFDRFAFPPLIHTNFGAMLPKFLDKRIRKALSSRPNIMHGSCTMCAQCVRICPPGVMKAKGKIEINYDGCIRCFCCQEICPSGAITVKEGWLKKLIPGM
ncbi:MAG: DUF362 domain-containing protein [Deltaproteobacteria bacterium]|nr:DUF362 domain-containing protein [Deltaproteobacteria bacterium]